MILTERGQATVEAFVAIPTLLVSSAFLLFFVWLGWLRFEVGQLVQNLGACLSSTQTSNCHQDFRQSLTKFPGHWNIRHVADGFDRTQVDLLYQWGPQKLLWRINEPKAFRLTQ